MNKEMINDMLDQNSDIKEYVHHIYEQLRNTLLLK